jgi:hypothetical protein
VNFSLAVDEHDDDRLLEMAESLPNSALAELLDANEREAFRDACARIERDLTDACGASGEPCLASGCSVQGTGEICLQPILRAGAEYHRACAQEWLRLLALAGTLTAR